MIALWLALGWVIGAGIFTFGYLVGSLMAVHRIEEAEAARRAWMGEP